MTHDDKYQEMADNALEDWAWEKREQKYLHQIKKLEQRIGTLRGFLYRASWSLSGDDKKLICSALANDDAEAGG